MSQPQYSSRNPPTSNRQLLILAGIFIAVIIAVIGAIAWVFNGLIYLIPPSVEQQLGAVVVPVYERQAQNSPAQSTLNQLLDRLEAQLLPNERKDRNYRVLYVPQTTVNAIALPGDAIVIYQGLLEKIKSENELMMVLGHELGHFAHRDHLRGLGRALLLQATLSYVFGDAGSLAGLAGSAVEAIGNSSYSQSQERQADEFGLALLEDTYGHVAGATDFFTRLSQDRGAGLDFLATHPAPAKRVRHLEQLIKKQNYPLKQRLPLPKTLSKV
jgi:predicted Zn-dependent protease